MRRMNQFGLTFRRDFAISAADWQEGGKNTVKLRNGGTEAPFSRRFTFEIEGFSLATTRVLPKVLRC